MQSEVEAALAACQSAEAALEEVRFESLRLSKISSALQEKINNGGAAKLKMRLSGGTKI